MPNPATSTVMPAPALPPTFLPVPRVYLSGPISGLTYKAGQDWREYAARILAPRIACYSPLRAHRHLDGEGELRGAYPTHPLTTSMALTARARHDCQACDLLLVNLAGATEVSIGTCIELGWADAFRKPIVLVMEPHGNVHDHPLVRGVCAFQVATLEEGLNVTRGILLPWSPSWPERPQSH